MRCVVGGVRTGDVTSVNYMPLCQYEPPYPLETFYEALEIIPITRSEFLMLAASAYDRSTSETIQEGYEEDVGILITKAKKSGVNCLMMSNFALFAEGVVAGIRMYPGVCREIRLKWNRNPNQRDEVQVLAD